MGVDNTPGTLGGVRRSARSGSGQCGYDHQQVSHCSAVFFSEQSDTGENVHPNKMYLFVHCWKLSIIFVMHCRRSNRMFTLQH